MYSLILILNLHLSQHRPEFGIELWELSETNVQIRVFWVMMLHNNAVGYKLLEDLGASICSVKSYIVFGKGICPKMYKIVRQWYKIEVKIIS